MVKSPPPKKRITRTGSGSECPRNCSGSSSFALTRFSQVLRIRRPCTKSPKTGKEGFGAKRPPWPATPAKRGSESKDAHLYTGHHRENGAFLTRNTLFCFPGWWAMGLLDSETLFPDFGIFGPEQSHRIRNPSKNLHSTPGCRQKPLVRNSGVGGGVTIPTT